jgi:hypothetical protein
MKSIVTKYAFILSTIILLATLPLTSISAASKPAAPLRVYVQNKEVKANISPVIKGGRVYVEFRSVAVALGFSFKYDADKQIITAGSEDISFKIDVKKGTTYIDGEKYNLNSKDPMTIPSGANTLVMLHLFNATDYSYAEYNEDTRIVTISENLWRKARTSDLRKIRSEIDKFYKAAYDNATITKYEVSPSTGSYTTIWVDVKLPKNETVLLDRLEHTEFNLERQEDNQWIIQERDVDTEYLDYQSLAQREVAVPEPDKSAIKGLITSYFKAMDEKNAVAVVDLLYSDDSKEDLIKFYKWEFQRDEPKNPGYKIEEEPTIVVYNSNKAMVYTVFSMKEKEKINPVHLQSYYLLPVIKASDGKWYIASEGEVFLGYDKLSN